MTWQTDIIETNEYRQKIEAKEGNKAKFFLFVSSVN